jgi:hypothetical protein
MRKLCPKCQGGRSRELSLSSVEVEGLTVWKCWRAKCGYRDMQLTSDAPPRSLPAYRQLPQALPLNAKHLEYLAKYHITPEIAAAYGIQGTSYDRLLLPIYSPRGTLRGWNVRGTQKGQSKANIYCTGHLTAAWFRAWDTCIEPNAPVIAVEDQLSAIRFAAAGITAVSLLGTNVSQAKIMEIDKVSHGNWLLALDADAIGKALINSTRHGIKVLRLSRDAKNCTPTELDSVIQRAINATGSSS